MPDYAQSPRKAPLEPPCHSAEAAEDTDRAGRTPGAVPGRALPPVAAALPVSAPYFHYKLSQAVRIDGEMTENILDYGQGKC